MGHKKRKQDHDEEEDIEKSASESDASQPEQTVKRKKASKAEKPSKEKTAKKPKYDMPAEKASPIREESTVKVLKSSEGDSYVDLGKKKHATVRSFKGQLFLDIREFYDAGGDERPGKKGITLSSEQWEALKRSVNTIDSLWNTARCDPL